MRVALLLSAGIIGCAALALLLWACAAPALRAEQSGQGNAQTNQQGAVNIEELRAEIAVLRAQIGSNNRFTGINIKDGGTWGVMALLALQSYRSSRDRRAIKRQVGLGKREE